MNITEITIAEVHEAFLTGALNCSQLVQAYIQVMSRPTYLYNQNALMHALIILRVPALVAIRHFMYCLQNWRLLQRITAFDKGVLQSVIALNPTAVSEAAGMDEQLTAYIANGTTVDGLPSLFCIPILVKDLYDFAGMPTTAGAVAFLDNYPLKDGTPVR